MQYFNENKKTKLNCKEKINEKKWYILKLNILA